LSPFTPSLPGGLEPQTYHERKTLPSVFLLPSPWVLPFTFLSLARYTRRQLYAVVSDVDSYASFVPFCTRSRVIRPLAPVPTPATPNAQQMEAELTVAFLAFTERYTSRVTCVPYESVKVRFPFTIFGKTSLFSTLCVSNPRLITFSGWVVGIGHG
jgi:coenzyme Q-binding protein COQ10